MKPELPVSHSHDEMTDFKLLFLSNGSGVVFWDKRVIPIAYSKRSNPLTSSPHHIFLFLWGQELGGRGEVHHDYHRVIVIKLEETKVKIAHTEGGQNSDSDSRAPLEDLLPMSVVSLSMFQSDAQRSRTTPTFQRFRS